MKPVDVKDNTYIDSIKEVNDKDPKFKVGDHVRTSKYKNIFAKGCTANCLKTFLWLKKLKIQFRGYIIIDLNGDEIIGTFWKRTAKD